MPVGVVAAVIVGLVLLVAAVSKIARPEQWRAEAAGMGVGRLVAGVVPWVELALGGLLVAQVWRPVVAWGAMALLSAFTALIALRLSQGRRPPCACFGGFSATPIGAPHLVRNVVFIAIAVLAAVL